MIADLRGDLRHADPLFHLTFGLTSDSRDERVNPHRYGDRTWFEQSRYRFSVFTRPQAKAIVAYLRLKAARDDFDRERVEEALASYWSARGV